MVVLRSAASAADLLVMGWSYLVNLRLALGPGVVNVDDLELGVEVERDAALLARSNTGALHAAERNLRFTAGGAGVHVRDAGFNAINELENLGHVARVNRGAQPEAHAVGNFDGFFQILHANYGEDGAEYFLLGDAHSRLYVVEDGRRAEQALIVMAAAEAISAANQLGPFLLADFQMLENRVELRVVY